MSIPVETVDTLLVSLTHFVNHPDLLAEHTMNSIEWEAVDVLMPRILRGKSKEEVKQLLLAEIDGMSKKRLFAVLTGDTLEESSSSEEEKEEIVEPDEVEGNAAGVGQLKRSKTFEKGEIETYPETSETYDHESGGDREEGEVKYNEDNESITPPDPGSPKSQTSSSEGEEKEEEPLDTDEEIDRQLDKDLEEFI